MSTERHIVVKALQSVTAFDGTTPISLALALWPRGLGNQKYSYTEQNRIGRFTPTSLGRSYQTHSRVRVYCDGPVTEEDVITVRGSLEETDGVAPINALRTGPIPLGTSLETAVPLELGPYDDVCVRFAGDGVAATLHFVIYDLDEAQLDRRDNGTLAAEALAQVMGLVTGPPIVTAVGAGGGVLQVGPENAIHVFEVTTDVPVSWQLPPRAGIPAGRVIVVNYFEDAGAAAAYVRVNCDNADLLDGGGPITGAVILANPTHTAWFLAVGTNGWKSLTNTTRSETDLTTTSAATVFTVGWKGRRILRLTDPVAAQAVQMPPFAATPIDCTLVVVKTANVANMATANGAELFRGQGVVAAAAYVQPAATVETYTFTGFEWVH